MLLNIIECAKSRPCIKFMSILTSDCTFFLPFYQAYIIIAHVVTFIYRFALTASWIHLSITTAVARKNMAEIVDRTGRYESSWYVTIWDTLRMQIARLSMSSSPKFWITKRTLMHQQYIIISILWNERSFQESCRQSNDLRLPLKNSVLYRNFN